MHLSSQVMADLYQDYLKDLEKWKLHLNVLIYLLISLGSVVDEEFKFLVVTDVGPPTVKFSRETLWTHSL